MGAAHGPKKGGACSDARKQGDSITGGGIRPRAGAPPPAILIRCQVAGRPPRPLHATEEMEKSKEVSTDDDPWGL